MPAFALSLDNLMVTTVTSGAGITTLPMWVFSEIRTGVKPGIHALLTRLIVLTTAVAVTRSLMTKRTAKRQQQLLASTA